MSEMRGGTRMRKKYIILAAVAGFIVALDQLAKIYIHTHFQLGESTPLMPGFFNITYVRNFGAAFGFLGDSHPAFRELFFLAMPPAALIIILLIMRGVAETDKLQVLALSSVFGGAIGNYIDRLRFRYVIDYLDFHLQEKYTWPAFNVADMAIVGGVGLLLILMFKEERQKKKLEARASS
jgi:signal peptidase II